MRSIFLKWLRLSKARFLALAIFVFLFVFVATEFPRVLPYSHQLPGMQFFKKLDLITYDFKLRLRGEREPSQKVGIIAIGERTLAALGRWPFSRDHHARLIRNLEEYNVRVAAFDIMFPEQEQSLVLREMEKLKASFPKDLVKFEQARNYLNDITRRQQEADHDAIFAKAVNSSIDVVFGFAFEIFQLRKRATSSDLQREGYHGQYKLTEAQQKVLDLNAVSLPFEKSERAIFDAQEIMRGFTPIVTHERIFKNVSNPALGFFSAIEDFDGIIRRSAMVAIHDDKVFYPLSVRAVEMFYGSRALLKFFPDSSYQELLFTDPVQHVPLEQDGTVWVNYYGRAGLIPQYEFIDVLNKKVNQEELAGKILFIGPTSIGINDNKATPIQANFPGVEIHASLADSILKGEFLHKSDSYHIFGLFLLTFGALIFGFLCFKLSPILATALTVLSIAAIHFVDQNFFFNEGLLIPTMLPTLQYSFILFGSVIYQYLGQEQEKKFIRNAFSQYVSDSVVDEIMKDHSKLEFGGQEKELTVMFADIVGFTKISEQMGPERISTLLKEFFSEMTGVIMQNRGTLDKYMGDAIMCFWGAPLPQADHTAVACKTAIEMIKKLEVVNDKIEAQFGCRLGLRIGINSGPMIVGNMGSYQHFDYTVLGDAVNLAARLESYNRYLHTDILVGPSVQAKLKDRFLFRKIDRVRFMGKEEVVTVYELMGESKEQASDVEFCIAFEKALDAYWAKEIEDAERGFRFALSLKERDFAANMYLERIERIAENESSAEWTGEEILKVK